ncbi:polysaccharide deacetylase family protein [Lysobacter sp. KIS68-7]|uniref:polysaccharide deacetylase family protein n=1 Tax=Lysobacter sp. KIS68-7 TaxID=2904252 RepID=UPI001E5D6878|nr:polysaccharide deacetylase family protein [Lysobacter sp. KIS68-7]UHQ21080.1 polysaccharide deacetylase family protein [Lysobacter sp. KIS68-7]
MLASDALRRVPRFPHVWAWCLVASQVLVVWIWVRFGWRVGLPVMVLSHAPFWWGTLKPGSALFSPVLRRLPTTERVAWITIDDGPSDDTRAMLDLLDAHHAKATFFLVGDRAKARPELVHEIAWRGHGIGNHSATHPQAWFWALPPARMREEIQRTQTTLRELTGTTPHWFRAVVGMANPFVSAVLKEHGMTRVAWSARGYDALAADPARVVARIERNLAPGAIVLMHEGAKHGNSVEVMRLVLERLRALGYRLDRPD